MVEEWRQKVTNSARGQVGPMRALDTIVEGLAMPFAGGMAHERRAFMDLMQTPERAALIHAFFAERRAAQQDDLTGVSPRKLDRVGIIGGGTMGQGIAAAALTAGLDVTLVERDQPSAGKAAAGIGKMLEGAVKRGKLAPEARDQMLSQAFRAAALQPVTRSIIVEPKAKAQKAEVHAQGVCQAAQSAVDQATAELDQARAALAAAEQGVDSPTDLQARVDAALRVWNEAERTLEDARKNRLQAEEVVSAAEKKAEGATQAHDAAVSADSDLAARRAQARATLDAARHHLAETRKADADAQQRVAEASAVVQEASQERADAVGMVGATSSAVEKAEADKVAADERLAHWSNVMIDDLIAAGSFGEDPTIDALVKKFVQARATAEYAKAALEKVAATEAEDSAAYAAALARYRTAVADLDKAEKALATHLSANTGRERETLSATTSRGTDQSARTAFEFPPATAGTTTLTDVSHHKVAEQPGGRVDNPVHIGLPPTGVDSDPVSSLGYIAASLTLAMGITIPRRKR